MKCKAFVVVSDDGTVVKAEATITNPTLVTLSINYYKFVSTWIPKSEVMLNKYIMFFGRNH